MAILSQGFRWPLAWIAMLAALSWPALWNGFPIVFYDSGGYLDAAMSGVLANGRSTVYGLFLRLGLPTDFWLDVAIQACTIAWLIVLTLRVHGLGGRPGLAAAVAIGLAALTALPWYAAQLMPDVWLATGVLALYLLAFRGSLLRGWERLLLGAAATFAIAGHMATLALLVGLLAALVVWRVVAARRGNPAPALRDPALAVAAGVLMILAANLLMTGHFTFTPGGENFLFGRLVQTGIAKRYIADHCPDSRLRICNFSDELPDKGDDWLWDEKSPLWRIGGWEAFAGEARHIVLDSLRDYPLEHLRAAARGTTRQFFMVRTGDDITGWAWHTHGMFERHAPDAFPDFRAARQQRAGFGFATINSLHVPVALGSLAGLVAVILLGRRYGLRRPSRAMALFVLVALVGNAAVCGILSNPHDRYQSRIIWLAPLALLVAFGTTRHSPAMRKAHISAATTP